MYRGDDSAGMETTTFWVFWGLRFNEELMKIRSPLIGWNIFLGIETLKSVLQ
jgi:hypothetical protein